MKDIEICKYYGWNLQCPFQRDFGNCTKIHDSDVRRGHEAMLMALTKGQYLNENEISLIMDSHDEEKSEEETSMRLELLRTYPPKPNERDI